MLRPQFETEYSSSFLSQLRSEGFTKWATMPRESGFFPLFAFGLLMHTFQSYPAYHALMQDTWPQIVRDLVQVDDKFIEELGEERFMDPRYWQQLGEQCRTIYAMIPQSKGEFRDQRLRDFTNEYGFVALTQYFMACLCVYENTESGAIKREFHSRDKGSFALVVCMAAEPDHLSFLLHKDFRFSGEVPEGFPNYVSLKITEPETPAISGIEESLILRFDNQPALHKVLVQVTNHLLHIAQKSLQQLNPSVAKTQKALQQAETQLQEFSSQGLLSDIDLAALQSVLRIPLQPAQHSIRDCSAYSDADEALRCCGQRFHKACLKEYLERCAGEEKLTLSCPNCSTSIPDAILERFPDIKESYQKLKERMMQRTWQPVPKRCRRCSRELTETIELDHGCILCKDCAAQSFRSGACAACQQFLLPADNKAIQSFGLETL